MIPFFQPPTQESPAFTRLLSGLGLKGTPNKALSTPYDWVDELSHLSIRSMPVRLSSEQLHEIPLPAIAFMKGQSEPAVIETVFEQEIYYWTDQNGFTMGNIDQFSQEWSGVSVLIESEEEPNKHPSKRKNPQSGSTSLFEQYGSTIIAAMAVIAIVAAFSHSMELGILLALKLIGLGTTLAIYFSEQGSSPQWLEAFCKSRNCGTHSKSSLERTLGLGFSGIGIGYFLFGLLYLFISLSINSLAQLSLLAGILSSYPLYLQFHSKQYCPLCLGSIGLIWAEALFGLYSHSYTELTSLPAQPIQAAIALVASFAFIRLLNAKTAADRKMRYWKELVEEWRLDAHLFESLLSLQPSLKAPAFIGQELIYGCREEPAFDVVIITNPHCSPCQTTHQQLEKLAWEFGEKARFSIRFSQQSAMAEAALALASSGEEEAWREALHHWSTNTNKPDQDFVEELMLTQEELEAGRREMTKHLAWSKAANFQYTPSVYINGLLLPKLYQLLDIRHYLRERL